MAPSLVGRTLTRTPVVVDGFFLAILWEDGRSVALRRTLSESCKHWSYTPEQKIEIVLASVRGERPVRMYVGL